MNPAASADFSALLEVNRRLIFKVANTYGRGRDDIDDLAQEIAGFRGFFVGGSCHRAILLSWLQPLAAKPSVLCPANRLRTKVVQNPDELLLATPLTAQR